MESQTSLAVALTAVVPHLICSVSLEMSRGCCSRFMLVFPHISTRTLVLDSAQVFFKIGTNYFYVFFSWHIGSVFGLICWRSCESSQLPVVVRIAGKDCALTATIEWFSHDNNTPVDMQSCC